MATDRERKRWRIRKRRYYRNHKEICLQRVKIIKARWAQEGRCSICGVVLLETEGRTCVNCSGSQKERFAHAKNCQRLAKEF
jgi:hypothetical protein